MKGSDHFKALQKQLTEANLVKAILSSALTVNADMSERIFVQGKSSDASLIGKYNTSDELYVNPNRSPKKFPTKGKEGKTKFKNGEKHKTGYFESYAEFRKKAGRSSSNVNLVLFGVLQSNFSNGLRGTNRGASVFVTEENYNKILGQEERFNKSIFKHTEQERLKYKRLVNTQFKSYAK